MKKVYAVLAVLIVVLLLTTALFFNNSPVEDNEEPVYVGVTYCGGSVEDAKLLIDKVRDYTNLFVLQSGVLQRDLDSVNELGDYAVSAGMHFLPYFGFYIKETFSVWLEQAKQRWGNSLLGVYYSDEPGGKMLDDYVEFKNDATDESVMKTRYGDVVLERPDNVVIHYELSGDINLFLPSGYLNLNTEAESQEEVYATFYPDGTIEIDEKNDTLAEIQLASLPDFATYEQLVNVKPLKDTTQVADQFVRRNQPSIEYLSNKTAVFTSDYALYWFDYMSGYDVILAHMGWNNTVSQQIGLVRGAATMQNKEWGIVVTWKYNRFPYLDTGAEILNQMTTAYECGAKYVVLFNYYETDSGPYGTMQTEHYEAIETFWNNVIQNPDVTHNSIKADSILVLPQNYGWGMRWPQDKIWGIFKADNQTQQIWNQMQTVLEEHDLKTDIVYGDPAFPLPTKYENVYYSTQP